MRPSILGFFTVGMTTLSMLSVSCVLYSAGSGERVLVVLSGLRWSWFCCVHEAISCKWLAGPKNGSWAHFPVGRESRCNLSIQIESSKATTCRLHPSLQR